MKEKIAIINTGSSSIKWSIVDKDSLVEIASGIAERINVDGLLHWKVGGEKRSLNIQMNSHKEAVEQICQVIIDEKIVSDINEIGYIGFRIVHGGAIFKKATIITDEVIKTIDTLSSFAPLHNPPAVETIKNFKECFGGAKLVGVFDTTFHTTIPDFNAIYGIDYKLTEELGIRKYGMHGISHQYITLASAHILSKRNINIVSLHIGNGASICAVKDGKSFDTTMGLTPLAGVMMGTRSGDIDPSIAEYVYRAKKIEPTEFNKILNNKSGLLGVSGVSSDLRDVLAASSTNKRAQLAVKMYVQKIVDFTATYINKLERCDAIVFTAGVGENSAVIREMVISSLGIFGIKLDPQLNKNKIGEWGLISTADSAIKVYVIRTNEELMIATEIKKIFDL